MPPLSLVQLSDPPRALGLIDTENAPADRGALSKFLG